MRYRHEPLVVAKPAMPPPTPAPSDAANLPAAPTSQETNPCPDLPRDHALAAPQRGLWQAISDWLASAGRLITLGFVVKRRRTLPVPPRHLAPTPRETSIAAQRGGAAARGLMPGRGSQRCEAEPHSLRIQTENTQLRAENRRLRAQLELAKAMQGAQSNTSGPRVQPDAGAIPLPDRLSATTNQNATSLSG